MSEQPHRYVPYAYKSEPERCLNCQQSRGNPIHLVDDEPVRQQPRVMPEAISWCISAISLEYWENRGILLGKAHQAKQRGAFHAAACGAQKSHHRDDCATAPVGWPACRHCSRRQPLSEVPRAFREALP